MDQTLNTMIENAYEDDPSAETLNRVVQHLQTLDLKKLPFWQQSYAFTFLFRTITLLAQKAGHTHPETGIVQSEFYQDSVNQLCKLSGAMAYSGSMSAWLKQRRQEFAYEFIRDSDFHVTRHNWSTLSVDRKLNFSQRFLEKMMSVYFRDLSSPPIPSIKAPEQLEGNTLAGIYFFHLPNGIIDLERITLCLSEDILENEYETVTSLIHEGTHLASRYLGTLVATEKLDLSHPAYADAYKRSFDVDAKKYLIPEVYDIDSEELMAFEHQDEFLKDLGRQHPSLKIRFQIAMLDTKNILKKIGAAMAPTIKDFPHP